MVAPRHRARVPIATTITVLSWLLLLLLGCGGTDPMPRRAAPPAAPTPDGAGRPIDPPAAAGALAPNLTPLAEGLALTWLEPLSDDASGHRMRFARLVESEWSRPVTVSTGTAFFANWADLPGVAVAGDGSLVAWWLEKTGTDTYAYSIFLARSTDDGGSWSPLGRLPADDSETEHGFVSAVAEGAATRFFWLDGRQMPGGGAMGLRTATPQQPAGEALLDGRACECCATDAALTTAGPVIAYRDRSRREVRDIAVVRQTAAGWSAPTTVHTDGWEIPGCPVNGPAIDAEQDRVAVAWFTAARGRPRVQVAFSSDAGASFGAPTLVDDEGPLGRVDLVLDETGPAHVSWLGTDGEVAAVKLAVVDPETGLDAVRTLATTAAARASGFPRLARHGAGLLLVWTEATEEGPRRLRALSLPGETPVEDRRSRRAAMSDEASRRGHS